MLAHESNRTNVLLDKRITELRLLMSGANISLIEDIRVLSARYCVSETYNLI